MTSGIRDDLWQWGINPFELIDRLIDWAVRAVVLCYLPTYLYSSSLLKQTKQLPHQGQATRDYSYLGWANREYSSCVSRLGSASRRLLGNRKPDLHHRLIFHLAVITAIRQGAGITSHSVFSLSC